MDFELDDEQLQLQRIVREVVERECPPALVRSIVQAGSLHVLEALGTDALDPTRRSAPLDPFNYEGLTRSWVERYLRSFAGTIAGGTSQIQRNIIAEQVLGLPR